MIKLKLTQESDNTFKRASIVNNQVQVDTISGSELKSIISSSLDSNDQLIQLRKISSLFKVQTITIKNN